MKNVRLRVAFTTLLLLANAPCAHAQEQTLFGKQFEPYSESRRDRAFEDLAKLRTDRALKLYGCSNGMLLYELEGQLRELASDSELAAIAPIFKEWLSVFPQSPAGSQRWAARHALFISRQMRAQSSSSGGTNSVDAKSHSPIVVENTACLKMANEMTSKVLAAALQSNWFPYTDLTQELQLLLTDPKVDPSMKKQAETVLSRKPLAIDTTFDESLRDAEFLTKISQPLGRIEIQKLDYEPYQMEWCRISRGETRTLTVRSKNKLPER